MARADNSARKKEKRSPVLDALEAVADEAEARLRHGHELWKLAERFDRQIERLQPPAIPSFAASSGGLLNLATRLGLPPRNREAGDRERLEEAQKAVEGDQILAGLLRDANYSAAVKSFRRSMKLVDPLSVEQYRLLLRFYEATANALGYYYLQQALAQRPRKATRDDVRRAADAAGDLSKLLQDGVRYHLPSDVWSYRDTVALERLHNELRIISRFAIATRNDNTLLEREYARRLAFAFLKFFKRPLKKSLEHLCACVGYTVNESTIRDRIKEAREKLEGGKEGGRHLTSPSGKD